MPVGRSQVTTGPGQSFAPTVATSPNGSVALAFYGSTAPDETDVAARWRVVLATSHDGRTFRTQDVSGTVHDGALCPAGCDGTPGAATTHVKEHQTVGLTAVPGGWVVVHHLDRRGAASTNAEVDLVATVVRE